MDSCVRETITGGTVTVGIDHSEVRGGQVSRTTLDCGAKVFELTGSTNAPQVAGRVFRGGFSPETAPSIGNILTGSDGL